jgi:hypothetical protein
MKIKQHSVIYIRRVLIIVVSCLWSSFSFSHHSPAASFDIAQTAEIEGIISSVKWANPHIYFTVDVQDDSGEVRSWEVEASSIVVLRLQGVERGFVEEGERVRISGLPSRQNRPELFGKNLFLEDGSEIVLGPFPRLTPDRAFQAGIDENAVTEASRNADGLFRVWSTLLDDPGSVRGERIPETIPFSVKALEAAKSWTLENDPFDSCRPRPVQMVMGSYDPFKIEKQEENILLLSENFDTRRIIHLNDDDVSDSSEYSLLGYSTGFWEDDTLIVETTNIEASYLNRNGAPSSRDLKIIEKFSVNSDGTRLDYERTLIDPEMLTQPFTNKRFLVWRPEIELTPFNCIE